jgi:hypothetical protein
VLTKVRTSIRTIGGAFYRHGCGIIYFSRNCFFSPAADTDESGIRRGAIGIRREIVPGVHSASEQLFINDNKQPSLIVNDLMHRGSSSGAIGLFVDIGTEDLFTDLQISND